MRKKLVKAKSGKKARSKKSKKAFSVLIECPFENPAEPDPDRFADLAEAALAVQQAVGLGLKPTITHTFDPVQKVCEGGYQVKEGKQMISIVFEGVVG
jgi:hypothetical protein